MSSQTCISAAVRGARELAAWFVAGLALSFSCAAQEPTTAIWKAQELVFTYFSSNSIYSCGALQDRVVSVLRAVGADSIKVSITGCDDFFIPESPSPTLRSGRGRLDRLDSFSARPRDPQVANVRLSFRSPILATPEALAELEKTKGYRELLGRVTGSSAAVQEAASQFPVQRQRILLSRRTVGFEPEECELVEQIARRLLPKLGVRVIKQNISCGQGLQLRPRLEVEALIKSPPVEASPPPVAESPQPAGAAAAEETAVATDGTP